MIPELAAWLVSEDAAPALALAAHQPGSLATGQALRKQYTAEQAAAASAQAALRQQARRKFGPAADTCFFTADGLQQATRPPVAAWRANWLVSQGITRVADLTCGLGTDAIAFRAAGLDVIAVEADPVTACFAQRNIGIPVTCALAEDVATALLDPTTAVFIDPSRRDAHGQFWGTSAMSPSLDWTLELLRAQGGCVKLAPGLDHALIPTWASAYWISHHGTLVEVMLTTEPNQRRTAVVLGNGNATAAEMQLRPTAPASVRQIQKYVYEPDPAVIRAGGIAQLAQELDAGLLAEKIAYLTSDSLVVTGLATAFAVEAVWPYDERVIRRELAEREIGTLEIKARGVEVDPAKLRPRLRLRGNHSATLILTETQAGARSILAHRGI
ncbi:MAG: class I SAM-dependent methyltransferase [Propionibacteriaceae bacterium]|jgi:hypothetical protein|nr:class I SAM-dependent methyltransferase [Propionibacteriaceae bacterium]